MLLNFLFVHVLFCRPVFNFYFILLFFTFLGNFIHEYNVFTWRLPPEPAATSPGPSHTYIPFQLNSLLSSFISPSLPLSLPFLVSVSIPSFLLSFSPFLHSFLPFLFSLFLCLTTSLPFLSSFLPFFLHNHHPYAIFCLFAWLFFMTYLIQLALSLCARL